MLIAAGVIVGLGLYTGTTGIIGRGLNSGIGAVFGLARYLVPLVLVGAGWLVLRSKKRKRRKAQPLAKQARAAAPWVALFIAAFCVLDLIGGRPYWSSPVEDLSRAGGWIGVIFGGTLERYLGYVGEIVVTVLLFGIAAVLLTSMSPGSAADSLADRFGGFGQRLRGRTPGLAALRQRAGDRARDARRRDQRPGGVATMFDDDPSLPAAPAPADEDADVYIDLRKPDTDDLSPRAGVGSGP